jgi:hypothetical protein
MLLQFISMDRNAYKLTTSQIGIEDGEIRLGKKLISLDEGRDMVEGFLGVRPRYPIDVALKLNDARRYFKQLLDVNQRNYD